MSMKRSGALRPKPADALVALAVVVAALLLSLATWGKSSGGGLSAVISVNGQVREVVELSRLSAPEERTITGTHDTLHVLLTSDGVEVKDSTCPNQDCVRTGCITRPGQSIVCLPARVSVVLTGASENAVDVVLG